MDPKMEGQPTMTPNPVPQPLPVPTVGQVAMPTPEPVASVSPTYAVPPIVPVETIDIAVDPEVEVSPGVPVMAAPDDPIKTVSMKTTEEIETIPTNEPVQPEIREYTKEEKAENKKTIIWSIAIVVIILVCIFLFPTISSIFS